MKKIIIEGAKINKTEDLYDKLALDLEFPPHFGRNLDALWDTLTVEIEGPVEILWKDAAVSKKTMGKNFKKVYALFKDIAKERDDFIIKFD